MSLYSGKHCSLSACPGWDSTVRSRSGFCLISSPPSSVAQFSAGLPAFRLVSVAAAGSMLQGLVARRINNLHGVLRNVMEYRKCLAPQGFPVILRHSVTLGRVWWWAQKWAQWVQRSYAVNLPTRRRFSPRSSHGALSSPSPRRSTSCISSRSRTGTGRSARPWEHCAEAHSGGHSLRLAGAPGNSDTPPTAQPPCAR